MHATPAATRHGTTPTRPPPPADRPGPVAAMRALRPVPVVLPDVVHRDALSSLAWAGLHLDGLLAPLWGDASATAGAPSDAERRALALAPLVPARGTVGRLAAAWVHTGLHPPDHVDVLVPSGGRRTDPHRRRRAAEAVLDDRDVLVVGGVRVTTVLRTGVDVARWVPDATAVPALRALVDAGLDADAALAELGRFGGHRGVVRAARLLTGLRPTRQGCGRQARMTGSSDAFAPVMR
ncbi:hypothetical protein [Cellulomonas sp. SLBN-39]|uniref:hypothetical protein n=1 Tax=Cellulomonas sp. SLBN-39 TaxID=2768446 RepID=UPI00114FE4C3|nr:hypothetical protein [Cellulomonas sp. SLBN-39]